MNSNLSGSLHRFNRPTRVAVDDDSEDDDANDANTFHECFEPSQTIFAPISTSLTLINPHEPQSQNEAPAASHQRIAVAALPNLEYDQYSMARGFSASSPSLYSQPGTGSRRNSDESDQRRPDFARNATASSSNYFV